MYWSLSTPMAQTSPCLPVSLAAWITPRPEPPAAAYTTSLPSLYIDVAISLPLAGSLKPVKSGGCVMYCTATSMSGLTALAPAT